MVDTFIYIIFFYFPQNVRSMYCPSAKYLSVYHPATWDERPLQVTSPELNYHDACICPILSATNLHHPVTASSAFIVISSTHTAVQLWRSDRGPDLDLFRR